MNSFSDSNACAFPRDVYREISTYINSGVPINTLLQDWFVYFRASLIAGLRYKMEQWNTKWNGAVNLHSHS